MVYFLDRSHIHGVFSSGLKSRKMSPIGNNVIRWLNVLITFTNLLFPVNLLVISFLLYLKQVPLFSFLKKYRPPLSSKVSLQPFDGEEEVVVGKGGLSSRGLQVRWRKQLFYFDMIIKDIYFLYYLILFFSYPIFKCRCF